MHPCLGENGIEPTLVFCLQEEVISDPEHQLLPGFGTTFGIMPLFAIAQEAWAALPRDTAGLIVSAFACRSLKADGRVEHGFRRTMLMGSMWVSCLRITV
jgi:hypothetical protein